MPKLFKITRNGRKSAEWHGKVKESGGRRRVKLFTDKTARERHLQALQRDADQRTAGVVTPEMDAAAKPVKQHAADYLDALKLTGVSPAHLTITTGLLNRLIAGGKWVHLADVTPDSLRGFVKRLIAGGRTVSYGNKFINVGKAFVHWLQADRRIGMDPLKSVKRGNERKAKKSRERRPLTADELLRLLTATLPDTGRNGWMRDALKQRQLAYAFAAYSGFRRAELVDLRWADLRLHATIPFIQLREEQTKNGKADALPIHPYLLRRLSDLPPGGPEDRVIGTVPDVKTLKKDLGRAGIPFADGRGRRADFHALRHTLSTLLAEAGCSDVARKALTRHADTTVNDGYTHARLSEMLDALRRLPCPPEASEAECVRLTGTAGGKGIADSFGIGDHIWDQTGPNTAPKLGPGLANIGGDRRGVSGGGENCLSPQVAYSDGLRRAPAAKGGHNSPKSLQDKMLGPDTQAD